MTKLYKEGDRGEEVRNYWKESRTSAAFTNCRDAGRVKSPERRAEIVVFSCFCYRITEVSALCGWSLIIIPIVHKQKNRMSSPPSFCNLNRQSNERGRMEEVICQNHTRGLENTYSVSNRAAIILESQWKTYSINNIVLLNWPSEYSQFNRCNFQKKLQTFMYQGSQWPLSRITYR